LPWKRLGIHESHPLIGQNHIRIENWYAWDLSLRIRCRRNTSWLLSRPLLRRVLCYLLHLRLGSWHLLSWLTWSRHGTDRWLKVGLLGFSTFSLVKMFLILCFNKCKCFGGFTFGNSSWTNHRRPLLVHKWLHGKLLRMAWLLGGWVRCALKARRVALVWGRTRSLRCLSHTHTHVLERLSRRTLKLRSLL
jgi:hypothetical protein